MDEKDRAIRGLQLRLNDKRKKELEDAKRNPLWSEGVTLWNYYLRATGHKGKFTRERFELVEPYLDEFGIELCMRAIDGVAFDPYKRKRANGDWKFFNIWEKNIFKDRPQFEEACKCSPKTNGKWTPQHLEP